MGKKVIKLTEADIRKIVQKVIAEQAVDSFTALKNAASGAGTDENALENVFASMKSKQDFINLDNQIKSNPMTGQAVGGGSYSSIQDVLNGELELGDYKSAERIKNYLKKIGVDLTFKGVKNTARPEQGIVSVEPNSFVVNVSKTETAKGKGILDTIKTVFSDATKSAVSGVEAALKQFPNSKVYFVIDPKTGAQRYFQYTKDGKTLTKKGSWKIENGKIIYDQGGSKPTPSIGTVRVAPTEDAVKKGTAFVEVTMSGDLIRKIQKALIDQGYLKIAKTTNYFGTKTDAAVRAFQKAKGLKVDGKVSKNTYEALFTQQSEPERRFPEEITNIKPKGLANVTQGIQTPSPITRQGNIQTTATTQTQTPAQAQTSAQSKKSFFNPNETG